MQPPAVVDLQEGVFSTCLEQVDELLHLADWQTNQLLHSERLQGSVMAAVVLCEKVIDAQGRVTVGHVDPTSCRQMARRL